MKSSEPFNTVAPDEVPDVPNSSFLMRRSRTPTPVREKRAQEAKNRFVCAFHFSALELRMCACATRVIVGNGKICRSLNGL